MLERNSTNNVFNFVQLRGAGALDSQDVALLSGTTGFARQLGAASPRERPSLAREHLGAGEKVVEHIRESPAAQYLRAVARETLVNDGTLLDFRHALSRYEDARFSAAELEVLSDHLTASRLADGPAINRSLMEIEGLYRSALASSPAYDEITDRSLAEYFDQPIVLPAVLAAPKNSSAVMPTARHPSASGSD